jgi:hypothetical protein
MAKINSEHRNKENSDFSSEPDDCRCSSSQDSTSLFGTGVTTTFSAILPLLPSFTCPACLAAYGGILSAFGLGAVLKTSVLNPLISVFLVIQVGAIGWTTRSHQKPIPLILTALGAGAIVAGRIITHWPVVMYIGIGALIAGAIWNLILKFDLDAFAAAVRSTDKGS